MESNAKDIVKLSKNIKVLFVEDNEVTRKEVQEILKMFFDKIITASDGLDGLKKFDENDIDLIITDIKMPQMDGLKMIEQIRAKNISIPIVVFSAHEESEYLLKAIELNVDGFLSKPININKFIQIIYKITI